MSVTKSHYATMGHRGISVAMGCWLLVSLGCGAADGPVRHPVRGQVLLNGEPVVEALVVFHPQVADDDTPRPMAQTDSEGRFELTTLQPHDGAPAGEYAVAVELRAERQVGEELVRDGADLLPRRYKSPQESGLTYTVTPGNNEVPPLQLTNR